MIKNSQYLYVLYNGTTGLYFGVIDYIHFQVKTSFSQNGEMKSECSKNTGCTKIQSYI